MILHWRRHHTISCGVYILYNVSTTYLIYRPHILQYSSNKYLLIYKPHFLQINSSLNVPHFKTLYVCHNQNYISPKFTLPCLCSTRTTTTPSMDPRGTVLSGVVGRRLLVGSASTTGRGSHFHGRVWLQWSPVRLIHFQRRLRIG